MSRNPTHPSQEKEESKEVPYRPTPYKGSVDVGLDTVSWSLRNGNLKIIQEVEDFLNSLKKKYIGVTD